MDLLIQVDFPECFPGRQMEHFTLQKEGAAARVPFLRGEVGLILRQGLCITLISQRRQFKNRFDSC